MRIAGPVIIIGVSMGIRAVVLAQSGAINDVHKQWGIAIFVLYLAQLAFGASIHFFKPKAWARGTGRRPFQNYFHAVTGLLLIAFAMFQVRASLAVPSAAGERELTDEVRPSLPMPLLAPFVSMSPLGRSARGSARSGLCRRGGAPSRTGRTSSGTFGLW